MRCQREKSPGLENFGKGSADCSSMNRKRGGTARWGRSSADSIIVPPKNEEAGVHVAAPALSSAHKSSSRTGVFIPLFAAISTALFV